MKETIATILGHTFGQSYIHVTIAFVFSIIRTMYSRHNKNILKYFMSAFVAIPVAVIVGEILKGYIGHNQGLLFASVAIAALLSESIVNGIILSGSTLQQKITSKLDKIYSKWDD